LVSGYVGMPEFINANRDLVKRYQRALLEGNAFANAHPDQTAPWLAEFAKVDLAVVKGSRREVFAESMDPAFVQVEINALVKLKLIDRGFDVHDMIATV
jgi:ABC-type nitrate/sulfonate/bicarbonate transport system substrate-binding protein